MDHESLAAAYSRWALSLWRKNQGIVLIWGGLQALEGSSVEECRSSTSAPRDLRSGGVLGTQSCCIITMLARQPITLSIKWHLPIFFSFAHPNILTWYGCSIYVSQQKIKARKEDTIFFLQDSTGQPLHLFIWGFSTSPHSQSPASAPARPGWSPKRLWEPCSAQV